MIRLNERYKKLPKSQITFLRQLLKVHGNGVMLVAKTGLNLATIKRASEGLTISEESTEAITDMLTAITDELNQNAE
jgi:hypothetical protein